MFLFTRFALYLELKLEAWMLEYLPQAHFFIPTAKVQTLTLVYFIRN